MDEVLKIALAEPLPARIPATPVVAEGDGTSRRYSPALKVKRAHLKVAPTRVGAGFTGPIMQIIAEFITSATNARDFPRDRLPEIALVGRSNVGKSSLINALVRRPLARTSAEPGKTRLVNVYRVQRGSSEPRYLVDLPGYGYARATKGTSGTERPRCRRGGNQRIDRGVFRTAGAIGR
jgi:hypothetical protein